MTLPPEHSRSLDSRALRILPLSFSSISLYSLNMYSTECLSTSSYSTTWRSEAWVFSLFKVLFLFALVALSGEFADFRLTVDIRRTLLEPSLFLFACDLPGDLGGLVLDLVRVFAA